MKVGAFAGTGQTTTLEMLAADILSREPNAKILYLSFNKTMADQAAGRLPKQVKCRTINAFALGQIPGKYKKKDNITANLSTYGIKEFFRMTDADQYKAVMINRTLNRWWKSTEPALEISHVKDFKGALSIDQKKEVLEQAKSLWEAMLRTDFPLNHAAYLKLYQISKPVIPYDYILLDEAQDTSLVAEDIVLSQVANNKKVVLVGDQYQGIYGWNGAVDVLQRFPAKTLHLTDSWRFGPKIAEVCNKTLNAYFGEKQKVTGRGSGVQGKVDRMQPHTLVTRTNARLFAEACDYADEGKQLYSPGISANGELPIFKTLRDFYSLWKRDFGNIRNEEIKCFSSFEEAVKLSKDDEEFDPEYAACLQLVKKYEADIPIKMEQISAAMVAVESDADVVLTTAHKAKGLEWDYVVMADDFKSLFKTQTEDDKAKDVPLEFKQLGLGEEDINPEEIHLMYMAATRGRLCTELHAEYEQFLKMDTSSILKHTPKQQAKTKPYHETQIDTAPNYQVRFPSVAELQGKLQTDEPKLFVERWVHPANPAYEFRRAVFLTPNQQEAVVHQTLAGIEPSLTCIKQPVLSLGMSAMRGDYSSFLDLNDPLKTKHLRISKVLEVTHPNPAKLQALFTNFSKLKVQHPWITQNLGLLSLSERIAEYTATLPKRNYDDEGKEVKEAGVDMP